MTERPSLIRLSLRERAAEVVLLPGTAGVHPRTDAPGPEVGKAGGRAPDED